jgi:hypothetical protein
MSAEKELAKRVVDELIQKAISNGIAVDQNRVIAVLESHGIKSASRKASAEELFELFDKQLRSGTKLEDARNAIEMEQGESAILSIAFNRDEWITCLHRQFCLGRHAYGEKFWNTPTWDWAKDYRHRGAWFRINVWNEKNPGPVAAKEYAKVIAATT